MIDINRCILASAGINTAQKMAFSVKDFFSKRDQIRNFLWIWSNLLKKSFEKLNFLCSENLGKKREKRNFFVKIIK